MGESLETNPEIELLIITGYLGMTTNLPCRHPMILSWRNDPPDPANQRIPLAAFGGILAWTITQNDQRILPIQRNLENRLIPLAAFGGILAWTVTKNDQQILPVQRNPENRRIPLAAFGGILTWTITQND